jgi:flagellar biosynthesis/type III secretory pathway chaperone
MTSNENADGLEQLEALCKKICHILEREHSVLCARNGLIGRGVDELELLHNEKNSELERLELLARNVDFAECAKVVPFRAREVRDSVERCKNLQSRNHQLFGRIVSAQRRITALLRDPGDDISVYDRGGRKRDYLGAVRSAQA